MLIRQGEKIVFFGDSLTQRTDLNESEHRRGGTAWTMLEAM